MKGIREDELQHHISIGQKEIEGIIIQDDDKIQARKVVISFMTSNILLLHVLIIFSSLTIE